jgi:alkanesulfonate monooxygenase SsuD/methylene tetrahydromethanopterin reductase-like flavin-dependent oxidoreductase (luciferase family)
MVSAWQRLEALDFDSLWVADHFVNPFRPSEPWFEGWTLLAALAARTTRARIGTLVTTITYRNPALLAREAMTVDHVSGGRLELGIGAGGAPLDHSMTGVSPWEASERSQRFDEFVCVLDRLLRGGPVTHEGRYYPVSGAEIQPATVQKPRPPLTLAAHGRKALKTVARYADVWNSLAGSGLSAQAALDLTRQRNRQLDDECAAQGRDPAALRRSFLVGRTPDTPFVSTEAFLDFVGRYREAGIDEFIFYWLPQSSSTGVIGDDATLERISQEDMPRARAAESA